MDIPETVLVTGVETHGGSVATVREGKDLDRVMTGSLRRVLVEGESTDIRVERELPMEGDLEGELVLDRFTRVMDRLGDGVARL